MVNCAPMTPTDTRRGYLSRRGMLKTIGAAGTAALAPALLRAQAPAGGQVGPPSTVTNPPRDFGPNGAPTT